MTTEETRHHAETALEAIANTPKGYVVASRKGIVAAALHNPNVAFRRENGKVHMELWHQRGGKEDYPLPADLQRRAAAMLDDL